MRIGVLISIAAALFTAVASAQETIYLQNADSPQSMQGIRNAVLAISGASSASVDAEKKALIATGTKDQLALAQWLAATLDRASPAPAFTKKLYSGTVSADTLAAVFLLAHIQTPQDLQEAVNTVRAVADIQYFFPYNGAMAVAAKGTADQIATAEWLLGELDPLPQSKTALVMHNRTVDVPARAGTQAQIVFLATPHPPQELQQMVNATRSVADVQRLFPMNSRNVLVLRATPELVEFADWMLTELDKPASVPPAVAWIEHTVPGDSRSGNLAVISYLMHTQLTQPLVDEIRRETKMQRVYPNVGHNAVAMRGTGDQLAQAKLLIQERDK